jgi:uncharacterized protein YndB with AHSA1/START domain
MADIFHNFPVNASPEKIFEAISRSEGLDKWCRAMNLRILKRFVEFGEEVEYENHLHV